MTDMWAWQLDIKDSLSSFENGRLEYKHRFGKTPLHAYVNNNTIVKIIDQVSKEILMRVGDSYYPPPEFPILYGVNLEAKDWVLPNIIYFKVEIEK